MTRKIAGMTFTHQDLCSLAVNWLQRAPGRKGPACQVAFSEAKSGWIGEIPDAIGFRTVAEDEGSVVVEVKVSRADFLADRSKLHRQDGATGMGLYRYYMALEGIIGLSELPERWGLVEVSAKGILTVCAGHVAVRRPEQAAWRHDRAVAREWLLLATMLSRVGDVESLHAELKKVRNERARLAKQCDAYAEQARARNLSRDAFESGETGSQIALRRRV
jgi:hypothetical protein